MTSYRCPKCSSPHSVGADRIFDGRLMFRCARCKVCAIVQSSSASIDESYLEFLDKCEDGGAATADDLRLLMEQERIIRPKKEVDAMLAGLGGKDPLLEEVLRSDRDYIVDFRSLEEPPPEYGSDINGLPVDEGITSVLKAKGIGKLYKFQEEAVKKILQGKDVVITAPTASGKTEAFCIPILQKIAEEVSRFGSLRAGDERGKIMAIFVYPTKALARDQMPKITELAKPLGVRAAVLDGDTPDTERAKILESLPDIIVTNFDVIHYHMMHRTRLSRALRTAKFLVVDEAHVYTGVFGANVHHIIARLERLAGGGKMQIAAASATLPNAADFCKALFGREMQVVKGRGRRGRVNLAIIFPSLRSHRSLALDIVKEAAAKGRHRTIAFSNSHLGSELLAFYAARQGVSIRVHRAGLTASARAGVEEMFKSGKLSAISATPTLELGIDIGDVDAIVSNIVPVNRLVQRIGRAARRGQQGYAFLALGNDPISQYYKSHPDDYLSDQEFAYTDPENPFVKEFQILAMACDRPVSMAESKGAWDAVQKLVSRGLLSLEKERFVPDFKKAMAVLNNYSIRGIGSRVDIKLAGKIAGDRSLPQALEELHQDAIYFLAGRRYRVKALHFERDRQQPYAELEAIPYDYPYYTKALTDEWPSILEVHERKKVFGIEVAYCSLKIQKRVLGYANIEIGQEVAQGKTKVMFDQPLEFEFATKGFVFRAPRPEETMSKADDEEYIGMSAFHASEHVIIEGSAMITGGASQDLGGISLGSSGLIFVYDGSVGGNGASKVLYDRLDRALGRALRILSECPCTSESGCPRCTYSYRCGNNNEYLHKAAAIEVMNRAVEGEATEIGDDEEIQGDRALV
ncbi:DEAD/DEAH box helicase [Nitrososphaera viennensis]|uniref:DEAD/DEAH box helicase n=1 Tax=Nitrososphaera viennensis TaxID=1034015 RepID=A0A977IBH7_9ARCH|nr:DEAD/DEAH box helicase [Nitrososphaera viennensis]UVS67755.1 DEAD/DEAH box helicase [Nitrososphaera viennensis]